MNARIERLWRRRPAESGVTHEAVAAVALADDDEATASAPAATSALDPATVPEPSSDTGLDGPEQPVLLALAGMSRQVHVGDVLLPVRRGWPRQLARLPEVPKRAILAARPLRRIGSARAHPPSRVQDALGHGGAGVGAQATMEITRIVFHGPLTAEAIYDPQGANHGRR